MEGITLANAKFEFYQDGNSVGTTEDPEILHVFIECQTNVAEDGFIVIKTSSGWSVDNTAELANLVAACERAASSILHAPATGRGET